MKLDSLEKEIDKISVIGRQCVAVTCLVRYCQFHNISHPFIDQYVNHVWNVTNVNPDNWSSWEAGFSRFPITGLGGPLPNEVSSIIPKSLADEFNLLIQLVLETSAVTWYTDRLVLTKSVLMRVIEILLKYNIAIPNISRYLNPPITDHAGWGTPLSNEDLERWKSWV
jgi:hypothetical protein